MNPRRILWVVVLLLGATASAQATEVVVYYHTDALHSATTLTNAQGQVIERTHYAPYGQVLNRALRDGPGYAGHEEDAATGLVYMQQRYYDPESGTFISADPVEANAGAGFNRYAYANNNPYRYTDPTGMCTGTHICNSDGTAVSTGTFTTSPVAGSAAEARLATAQARLNKAANYLERHKKDVAGSYSSPDSAKTAFGKTFAAESAKLGVEFGANIMMGLGQGGLNYSLTDFSASTQFICCGDGAGNGAGVAIAGRPGDPAHWGMVHTHWNKVANHGNFFSWNDWTIMIQRKVNGFVIFPDQTSQSFDYSKYDPRTMTPGVTYYESAKFSF